MIASMDDLSKRSLYDARGSLKVSVKDYGPGECMLTTILLQLRCLILTTTAGLTVDNLKRLFGEGVQFNANKLQAGGGSGLGLWIAKGMIIEFAS